MEDQANAYKENWTLRCFVRDRFQVFARRPIMHLVLLSVFVSICASVFAQSGTVDTYVATERYVMKSCTSNLLTRAQFSPIAKAGILANIGPSGSKSSGAKVCSLVRAHVVLASNKIE